MHNNYYFLRQLSKQLQQQLVGWELATCFSQNKDELILGFCTDSQEFYIRASLGSHAALLAFPPEFQRARRNSVDLFPELIGKRVTDIVQLPNERSFFIELEADFCLLFKMHGNRSNIVLFEKQVVISLFKNALEKDWAIVLADLGKNLDWTKAIFDIENGNLKKLYPTLGQIPLAYLQQLGYETASLADRWAMTQSLLLQLEKPVYAIGEWEGKQILSLLPIMAREKTKKQTVDVIEAANLFANEYSHIHFLEQERQEALLLLQKRQQQTANYLLKTEAKLQEIEITGRHEEIGHILMANLHAIPARAEKVVLEDFYRNNTIEIKLKPDLSPQRNAENYYRKAKNQKIEIEKLYDNLARKEQEKQKIAQHIAFVIEAKQLKEIRKYLKDNKIISQEEKEEKVLPFRRFEYEGWEIWVGKNAQHNDELTQRYSHKEDLWLHARDVSGSHVLLKYKAGKPFPSNVIERAASLAAYYSKRKSDTLCPVICTPKKFVRKIKGAAAGSVMVDKEEVILVKPMAFNEM